MNNHAILVDWGTSHARFWLVDGAGTILASAKGKGVGQLGGSSTSTAMDELAARVAQLGGPENAPIYICGMGGSPLGLIDAGYQSVPVAIAELGEIGASATLGGHDIFVISGLKIDGPLGVPDVMRGEEVQALGLFELGPKNAPDLVIFPGTHNKWVKFSGEKLLGFHTAMSGELFQALASATILMRGIKMPEKIEAPDETDIDHAFLRAVQLVRAQPLLGLEVLAFSARTLRVSGQLAEADIPAYLSGLVIGTDVRAGLHIWGPPANMLMVGAPSLCALYRAAFGAFGIDAHAMSGDDLSLKGLMAIWRRHRQI